jgi:hypothetical protein
MKSSRVIFGCLIGIMLAASASAEWVPLTGDPVPLSSLQGGSLIFGDKELSEIDLFGIGDGGAIAPNASAVFVQGGWDDATGDHGLRFVLSWNAFAGQTVNANLSFKISVLDANYIKDVSMYLTGISATGTGGVNIGETVWDAPFPEGNVIASLSVSKHYNDNGAFLSYYAKFEPLEEIWIRSKDISLTGGTNGAAHLSEFFQFYSQIPEPATLILLGSASIWIFTRKKHRFLGGYKSR